MAGGDFETCPVTVMRASAVLPGSVILSGMKRKSFFKEMVEYYNQDPILYTLKQNHQNPDRWNRYLQGCRVRMCIH